VHLHRLGKNRCEIDQTLGIRYQHVRNVLLRSGIPEACAAMRNHTASRSTWRSRRHRAKLLPGRWLLGFIDANLEQWARWKYKSLSRYKHGSAACLRRMKVVFSESFFHWSVAGTRLGNWEPYDARLLPTILREAQGAKFPGSTHSEPTMRRRSLLECIAPRNSRLVWDLAEARTSIPNSWEVGDRPEF
jgi:hypothetical protein